MKIKKMLSFCLAIALTFAFTNAAQAQVEKKTAKEKQEMKIEKPAKAGLEKADSRRKPLKPTEEEVEMGKKNKEKEKAKAKRNAEKVKKDKKGKAHKRFKRGQSGKDFGKKRAEDAKSKEKSEKGKSLQKAKAGQSKSFERR